jgi:ATP-dependent DNA helicase RecG
MNLLQVMIGDETGRLELVFFNQPFLKRMLPNGREVIASGEIGSFGQKLQLVSPEIEILDGDLDSAFPHAQGIVPVYPLTRGVNQRWMRKTVHALLEQRELMESVQEILPREWLDEKKWPLRESAFRQIHFPDAENAADSALERFKFEEAFLLQLLGALSREQFRKEKGPHLPDDSPLLENFIKSLPFQLTRAQEKSQGEILEDLRSGRRMNRMLQGDVGSGKTVVALGALLSAIGAGYQAAFMVPIEILAAQHFRRWQERLAALGVRSALLTGSTPAAEKKEILSELESGELPLVFGTQALIQEGVNFHNLGFAVVDEQHRFGVRQRASFHDQGRPHVLIMSATPIPRSLAMTLYGDLDLSIIDELPPGRPSLVSRRVGDGKTGQVYDYVKERLEKGERGFLIFPLVEESDKLELQAATERYEELSKTDFRDFHCELIHGRMNGARKAEVMERFASGETQLLIATTVIEVGIDIPEATLMVIHNPERFGLSQLHQLRGRIGRGTMKSYCILLEPGNLGEQARQRLEVFVKESDGFVLAEEDLKIRGPGDFFGVRQHGMQDLRLVHPIADAELVALARQRAQAMVSRDPQLMAADLQPLRELLDRLYRNRMPLAGVG